MYQLVIIDKCLEILAEVMLTFAVGLLFKFVNWSLYSYILRQYFTCCRVCSNYTV